MPIGVHATHCCSVHGCKYGDTWCPVTSGHTTQVHPCEQCDDEVTVTDEVTVNFEVVYGSSPDRRRTVRFDYDFVARDFARRHQAQNPTIYKVTREEIKSS